MERNEWQIFSLKDLDNLLTDSSSGSMAHVRAPLDQIDTITVIESRAEDQASFNRFPYFLFYGGISALILILETPNSDSDRALRA